MVHFLPISSLNGISTALDFGVRIMYEGWGMIYRSEGGGGKRFKLVIVVSIVMFHINGWHNHRLDVCLCTVTAGGGGGDVRGDLISDVKENMRLNYFDCSI